MLQLIEGGAKAGKSTRIRQDLLALADREEISSGELLLLVPEQFSYETERAYYHALGIRRADRVQVLSFKRLSDEVFREYGGLAGETAGDPAKLLAMKLALQDCKGELRLYVLPCAALGALLSRQLLAPFFRGVWQFWWGAAAQTGRRDLLIPSGYRSPGRIFR